MARETDMGSAFDPDEHVSQLDEVVLRSGNDRPKARSSDPIKDYLNLLFGGLFEEFDDSDPDAPLKPESHQLDY